MLTAGFPQAPSRPREDGNGKNRPHCGDSGRQSTAVAFASEIPLYTKCVWCVSIAPNKEHMVEGTWLSWKQALHRVRTLQGNFY